MTPEQIKGRCREVLRDFTEAEHAKRELDVLESLYREAMAAGLEMAADIVWEQAEGDIDLARWKCRREAQRVKENHEDHKAGSI